MAEHISTDHVIDAVRATRDVYLGNGRRLMANDHVRTSLKEFTRAALMDTLLADDNLCEMFAGRLHQISHGTPKS